MLCGQLDSYILAQYPFSFKELVCLGPVYMSRIKIRTIPFIVQNWQTLKTMTIQGMICEESVQGTSWCVCNGKSH